MRREPAAPGWNVIGSLALVSFGPPPDCQGMTTRLVSMVLGIICTIFFLALALYRVPLATVAALLARVDFYYIGLAFIAYGVDLALRAWRWQIILRPLVPISYPTVAKALLVGYGLNAIMPARLGELLRAEFLKQSQGVARVWVLTSIVIERMFDGMTVVACLGAGLFFASTNNNASGVLVGVMATGAVVFGAILVLVLLLARDSVPRPFKRFPGLSAQMNMVRRGMEVLRSPRTVGIAVLSLIVYVPEAFTQWSIVKSVGLQLDLSGTLVLLGATSLSTLVPSGPAFLGTLQFAYATAIEFAGGSAAVGIASATLIQLCLFLPLAVVGAGIFVRDSGSILRLIRSKRDPNVPRSE
jgi:glycosyltransferase 2 family protein